MSIYKEILMQVSMPYLDIICKKSKGLKFFGRWPRIETSFYLKIEYISNLLYIYYQKLS